MAACFIIALLHFYLYYFLSHSRLGDICFIPVRNIITIDGRVISLSSNHNSARLEDICFVLFQTVIKRVNYETSLIITTPINKTTKHGMVTLANTERLFKIDLTVHMDIKPNPDPNASISPDTRRQEFNFCANNTTIGYTRNQLMTLKRLNIPSQMNFISY